MNLQALWAIPNMTDSSTRTPFIITTFVIGFITYIIVFNLGNISGIVERFYVGYRSELLEKMGGDPNSPWKKYREQFEEFLPNIEQKRPSEWWIIFYQIQVWFRKKEKRTLSDV